MGLFGSIPDRANGDKFYYYWFNSLRDAGKAIENFLGGSYIAETSVSLANNQVAASSITGLLFDHTLTQAVHIYAEVRRSTSSTEVISSGRLIAFYRVATTTWELLDELSIDDDGVVFSITSAGQIQYTSDNMSGTGYAGTMKFKAITFGI